MNVYAHSVPGGDRNAAETLAAILAAAEPVPEPRRVVATLSTGHPLAGSFIRSMNAFVEHERLLRALFLVTGGTEEADELMQHAFVAVWERLDRVGTMHDPTGYLYRTAMNRFRSRLRAVRTIARGMIRADPRPDLFEAVDDRDTTSADPTAAAILTRHATNPQRLKVDRLLHVYIRKGPFLVLDEPSSSTGRRSSYGRQAFSVDPRRYSWAGSARDADIDF